eukprot:Nk52_evm1s1429 gene=Nk52_evmTU1s1429
MTVLVLMLMSPQLAAGNPDLHWSYKGKYYVREKLLQGHVYCEGFNEPGCREWPAAVQSKSISKLEVYSTNTPTVYSSSLFGNAIFKITKIYDRFVEWELVNEDDTAVDYLNGACSKEKRHFNPLCRAEKIQGHGT